jgi:hypothetical protein
VSDTSFGLGLGAGLPTDRLTDLELTNAGGQGLLYRANDSVLGRSVAVKVLTTGERNAPLPQHVEAQARMSWHPYVMTLFDAGRTSDGFSFLVMEYLEGGSFEQLRKRGPVAPDRAIELAAQLGDALQASHERGLLHCDVKPANVMLDSEGNARLGDFGSSRELDRSAATLEDIQGSLMYLAPEILEGVRPSAASDVYSLALSIWTLLTGELPWGDSATLGEAIAVRLRSTRLDFEPLADRPRLRKLLEAATDTDPDRRPLLPVLLTELREATPTEHDPARAAPRRRGLWVAALVALVVGGLIGYVAHPSERKVAPAVVGGVTTIGQFCSAFAHATTGQLSAIGHLTDTITDTNPTYGDIKAMIVDYPSNFADAYESLVPVAAARPALAGAAGVLTHRGLEDMALVDGLYRFQYDEGLVDPATFEVSTHAQLSTSVFDTATAYAHIAAYAEASCPPAATAGAGANLTHAMTAGVDSMRGHLVAGSSLDKFFDDPRSLSLFNADQVDLILSSAPYLFGQVFAAQTPWMIKVLEQHSEIRTLLFAQHLPEFVGFLAGRPDLIPEVIAAHPAWSAEARARFLELSTDQQAALTTQYGTTLHALGILTSVSDTPN